MTIQLERYRQDLERLIKLGDAMLLDLARQLLPQSNLSESQAERLNDVKGLFEREYQTWFSEALAVVEQLLPSRKGEFAALYKRDIRRKGVTTETYSIEDWMLGIRAPTSIWLEGKLFEESMALSKFKAQLGILGACERRFQSSLFEIRTMVQADILDSELAAAKELLNSGYARAAGAITGVLLEKHLAEVALNHSVELGRKRPTLANLNEALKSSGVIDVPTWRQLQYFIDIRNLCTHRSGREPGRDEVQALIDGAEKVTKTIH